MHDPTLAAKAACLIPKQIAKRQFLGVHYDFQRDGILVRGKEQFLNEFFFYQDEERKENIVPYSHSENGNGFAYAFSDPPYGLFRINKRKPRVSGGEIGDLFSKREARRREAPKFLA